MATMAKRKFNPLSYDLGDALLARHRQICAKFLDDDPSGVPQGLVEEAIIPYKKLLEVVRAPVSLAESIGTYLEEVAEWCDAQTPRLPPINALAVNGLTRRPGVGYYTAPGATEKWELDVRDCISCKRYPLKMSN